MREVILTAFVTTFVVVHSACICFGEPLDANQDSPGKLHAQLRRIIQVESAVSAWFEDHESLPETLDELVEAEGYLDSIPEDIYASGRSLSYRLGRGKRFGIVYSYGPDGDDDHGVCIPVYRIGPSEPVPDGDMVIIVWTPDSPEDDWPANDTQRQPETLVTQGQRDTLKGLRDIREQEGRDNAMIYYVEAASLRPYPWERVEWDMIPEILDTGWDPRAKVLLQYMAEHEPMFEKIRKGASVGYARNIGITNGHETPFPVFLYIQDGGKMMCIQGRYLEYQEKYQEALENYVTVLTMGRDLGSPGGMLIQGIISAIIQNMALEQIYRLVTTDHLDRASLDRLAVRLGEIEKTQTGVIGPLWNDAASLRWCFARARANPEEGPRVFGEAFEEIPEFADAVEQIDEVARDFDRFWDFEMAYLEKPYWERDRRDQEQRRKAILEVVHPIINLVIPDIEQPDARYRLMTAKLRLTRIVTALARYKLDHEGLPEHLSGLVPEYLDSVPVDPFSGERFSALYSVGPDREDNGGRMQYDPTNGTFSVGDVFLR